MPHIDSFSVRLHPDDRQRTEAAIARAIESCGEYAADYRVVHPDGSVRWVAARGRVLRGQDGGPVRMLGAAYDTTAVHSASERLGRTLETMSTAFFTLDRDWRFTYLNAEAERILGRRRDELIGEMIWEVYDDIADTESGVNYRAAMESGQRAQLRAVLPAAGRPLRRPRHAQRRRAERLLPRHHQPRAGGAGTRGGARADRRRDRAPADPQRRERAAGGHARRRRAAADPRRRRAQRLRRRPRDRARRAPAGRVAQPGDPGRARHASTTTRPAPRCSSGWPGERLEVERFGARTAVVAELIPALADDALAERPALALPLISRGRMLGAAVVIGAVESALDRRVLVELAARARAWRSTTRSCSAPSGGSR